MKQIGPMGSVPVANLDPLIGLIRTSSIAYCVQRDHIIYTRQTQRGNLLTVNYSGQKPEIAKITNVDHLLPKEKFKKY